MDADRTLIVIEYVGDVKQIHYIGYSYYNGEPEDKPYRWVEYTFLTCPLSEAIKCGIREWESDNQADVKQYICDLSEDELYKLFNDKKHEMLDADKISETVPCGTYWI